MSTTTSTPVPVRPLLAMYFNGEDDFYPITCEHLSSGNLTFWTGTYKFSSDYDDRPAFIKKNIAKGFVQNWGNALNGKVFAKFTISDSSEGKTLVQVALITNFNDLTDCGNDKMQPVLDELLEDFTFEKWQPEDNKFSLDVLKDKLSNLKESDILVSEEYIR